MRHTCRACINPERGESRALRWSKHSPLARASTSLERNFYHGPPSSLHRRKRRLRRGNGPLNVLFGMRRTQKRRLIL